MRFVILCLVVSAMFAQLTPGQVPVFKIAPEQSSLDFPVKAMSSKDSQTVTDQDVKLLRQDLRSQKKQLIAANLTLTDTESTKFWPVYDQFSAEMTTIGDQKYALIKEYAQNFGSLTDAQAQSLLDRSLALDEATAKLRIKYVPIVNKVLPGTKTATFFQMERRISALIDLQMAAQIPLVQDQH